jgi:hypothetical protein
MLLPWEEDVIIQRVSRYLHAHPKSGFREFYDARHEGPGH